MAVLLPPYYRNLTSSVIKTPKLFWTDIGIWRQLTGMKSGSSGQLYETMVVAEMIKWFRTWGGETNIFFYRTRSGLEVDLLPETPGGMMAMEIKSRPAVGNRDIHALQAIAQSAPETWGGRAGCLYRKQNRAPCRTGYLGGSFPQVIPTGRDRAVSFSRIALVISLIRRLLQTASDLDGELFALCDQRWISQSKFPF